MTHADRDHPAFRAWQRERWHYQAQRFLTTAEQSGWPRAVREAGLEWSEWDVEELGRALYRWSRRGE